MFGVGGLLVLSLPLRRFLLGSKLRRHALAGPSLAVTLDAAKAFVKSLLRGAWWTNGRLGVHPLTLGLNARKPLRDQVTASRTLIVATKPAKEIAEN